MPRRIVRADGKRRPGSRSANSTEAATNGGAIRHEVSARELIHRLRNVFPLILTIVRQTKDQYPEAGAYCQALEQRIRSLAAAETLVDKFGAVSLADLIRLELAPFQQGNNISIEGPNVWLEFGVQDFAILIHELTTNAVKHGALSNSRGVLSVTWSLNSASDHEPSLVLNWIERDGPKVVRPKSSGFGAIVIAEGGNALGGKASVKYNREGFQYRLILPAKRLRGDSNS
jgi:two-component sensor histidine kinase